MKIFRLIILCLLAFSGDALHSQGTHAADTMHWRMSRPLSWGDFKGRPGQLAGSMGEAFCMNYSKYEKPNPLKKTKYKVFAIWDRSKSWVNPTSKTAEELLYYQTLFNIYEVHARKLRKEFSETKFGINPDAVFQEKYNANDALLINECNEFKNDTESGSNGEAVKRWAGKVKMELEGLEQYTE